MAADAIVGCPFALRVNRIDGPWRLCSDQAPRRVLIADNLELDLVMGLAGFAGVEEVSGSAADTNQEVEMGLIDGCLPG